MAQQTIAKTSDSKMLINFINKNSGLHYKEGEHQELKTLFLFE